MNSFSKTDSSSHDDISERIIALTGGGEERLKNGVALRVSRSNSRGEAPPDDH